MTLLESKQWCQWGRFRCEVIIVKVTRYGNVYGKRWNTKRREWTKAKRLYPWKGMWTTEPQ